MSYTELKVIEKNNNVVDYKEYANAWGGTAYIWEVLYNRYVKKEDDIYDHWMFKPSKVWDLFRDKSVPLFVRAVLGSTFDYVIIKKENLSQMIKYYKNFIEVFPPDKDTVCHIQKWVEDIKEIEKSNLYKGIAFVGTSVGEDLWVVPDENNEESIPYNIDKNKKHWFLFDEIEDFEEKDEK